MSKFAINLWRATLNMRVDTVYIDHNVLVREDIDRLARLMSLGKPRRFAFSMWNLVEIANSADRRQAAERIKFMEETKPIWLMMSLDLQRLEVQRFIWKHCYGVETTGAVGWHTDFNRIMPPVGMVDDRSYTASRFLRYLMADRKNLNVILDQDAKAVEALTELQNAGRAAVRGREKEVFGRVMSSRLPERDPKGNDIRPTKLRELSDFAWKNRRKIYQDCRTLALENKLYTVRTSDSSRVPNEQDGRDLQHTLVGMSCCDHFVTGDAYIHQCAAFAVKELPKHQYANRYRSWGQYLAINHPPAI